MIVRFQISNNNKTFVFIIYLAMVRQASVGSLIKWTASGQEEQFVPVLMPPTMQPKI